MAVERNEFRDAEEVLLQIANGQVTDRPAHELALLKLANLYFLQKQYDKSSTWCKEVMKQYPAHPNVLSVRELLGECYGELAKAAKANADNPEVLTAEKKQLYRRLWLENLEARCEVYQQLADDLEARAANKPLPMPEDKLRRKAALVVGDCYFEMPNCFDKALDQFGKLFERYRDHPDGLWACERSVRCLGQALVTKHPSLNAALELAGAAVEHCIRVFDSYDRAGAFSSAEERTQWQEWLTKTHAEIQSLKRGGQ